MHPAHLEQPAHLEHPANRNSLHTRNTLQNWNTLYTWNTLHIWNTLQNRNTLYTWNILHNWNTLHTLHALALPVVSLPGDCLLFISLPDTGKCLWLGVRAGCWGPQTDGEHGIPPRAPCLWPPPQH